ncbi:hypothetical protein Tco_0898977 [Tanacetum coccineum]
MVAMGHVCVLHVQSHYQYADIFTKGLPSALFEEFRTSLSVRLPPAQTAGECTGYSLKDKIKAKDDKTEHGMEEREKDKVKTKAKGAKGLKTVLKRTFPDLLDNLKTFNK